MQRCEWIPLRNPDVKKGVERRGEMEITQNKQKGHLKWRMLQNRAGME